MDHKFSSDHSFADRLQDFGDATAIVTEDQQAIGYREFVERADAFADELGEHSQLLLLECSNTAEALIAYIGALRGRHPVILTSPGHPHDVSRMTGTYRPDAIFRLDGDKHVLERKKGGTPLHPALAAMLSTSGTTGATKLVRLSHENLTANAVSIASFLGLTAEDRAITSLPFHYSYGLSVVNSHLAMGGSLVLTGRSVIEEEFWRLFTETGATTMAGVPYTYELLDRVHFQKKSLSSLRLLTQAGGRLPAEVAADYAAWSQARDVRFFVMYGQTEATARMSYVPPESLAAKPATIGIPIPGGSFTLVDDRNDEISAPDTTGELVYRGPNVMMGYAESHEDLARGADIAELRTGDLAQRDADGCYRIVGRLNRFVKLYGLRIALDEVERRLRDAGYAAAVTGDDRLIAVAITNAADPAAAAEMLAQTYSLPATAFSVATVTDLPLLASGKIDYRQILADAVARQASTRIGIDRDIRSAFALALPRRKIASSDSFLSLGGDSLAFIALLTKLDQLIGNLPDGWEELSIAELQALADDTTPSAGRADVSQITIDMALRALAITMVVSNHVLKGLGGGVDILLLIAGVSLMRFQWGKLMSPSRWQIAVEVFIRFIIPYYIIIITFHLLSRYEPARLADYLLVGNFLNRNGTIPLYWFIIGYFQFVLIILGIVSIPIVRKKIQDHPRAAVACFLGGAILVKLISLPLIHPAVVLGQVPGKFLSHTPDQFLYLPALGFCIYFAKTTLDKLAVLAAAIGIAVLTDSHAVAWWWGFEGRFRGVALVFGTACLLYVPRISVPRAIRRLLIEIASASFIIYLTHPLLLNIAEKLHRRGLLGSGVPYKMLEIFAFLAIGVAVSKGWQKAIALWGRRSTWLTPARSAVEKFE